MYIVTLFALLGCIEKNKVKPTPEPDPQPDIPSVTTYEDVTEELTGYPSGLKVYSFKDYFDEKVNEYCSGFYAIADLSKGEIKFNCVYSSVAQPLTAIFNSFDKTKGAPLIGVNGGYFWSGESLSLLISESQVKSIAARTAWVNGKSIYPVRAAIGQMEDGSFEATWVYCPESVHPLPYSYPSPLDNNEKYNSYMPIPPGTTPAFEGKPWKPVEAIGAGPMIVLEGKDVVNKYYYRECLEAGGTAGMSRQPRTSVGATKDGKVVLLVCDGRGKNGSKGYTLSEMATLLISLGVQSAINLDGGGSSTFVGKEGKVLNIPSDSKNEIITQRAIPTAIVLSKK